MATAAEHSKLASNPFCTRFIYPGAFRYEFASCVQDSPTGAPVGFAHRDGPDSSHRRKLAAIVEELQRAKLGLIVGPHGSGKSTLIQTLLPELRKEFVQVGYLRLHGFQGQSRWQRFQHASHQGRQVRRTAASAPTQALIIIDGMEQLSPADRWWLKRHALRKEKWVLGTSHKTLGGFLTLHTTTVSRPLVQWLCDQLLHDAPPQTCEVVRERLQRTDIHSQTDIRKLWFDLYDAVASSA